MNSAHLDTSLSASSVPILSMDMGLTGGADFLSFILGSELYGVALSHVEEIRVWEAPTPIPRAPHFVKGVINLRGMIVPIIDLRLRFGLTQFDYLPTTVVLILSIHQQDQKRLMGVVVDSVSDVIGQGEAVLNPAVGESLVVPFLSGILNVGDEVMSLLDGNALLDMERILSEGQA
ncbi:chemotaxis protein CheW [Vibrio metoecus]|uniref:chemotaxis protein CheW n=1 Tax=Vibrio metoecus TaxID=1481663 RepID=UPI0006D7CAF7|nr:chemotaxis protein CheW [Vibrio metoecus]KQA99120.1 chemotaxis protein CheW [Vibrio metoecus]PAR58863.1 chemotaxis protein CheW [Vibrio metoecus]PAR70608.1 chemotaxis protein CheW [Vibrio metoecus]